MLFEKVADRQIIMCIMAVMSVIGVFAEIIARMITGRLLREARNIQQSVHPLMKLIKAKYEHANLVTERVQNVDVFVDKYLYEYQVLGIKCHRWQKLGLMSAWEVLCVGLLGAAVLYLKHAPADEMIELILCGMIGGIGLLLFHILLNDREKMGVTRTYIVDYLQNVCAHRFEKSESRPKESKIEEKPASEMRIREILGDFLA